jgi:integrase/recombinase XerC
MCLNLAEKRSKRIELWDKSREKEINKDNLKLYQKYEMDMSIRELSKKTIYGYKTDIFAWFMYVLDFQQNQCITDFNEDDITEFIYYCKQQGNHTERIKRRMASLSAFYKFLRKKKMIKENPMEFMDRPKHGVPIVVQTFLTEEQVKLMKEKLKECGDLQLELYGLLSLSTMARVNAISNIIWDSIDFDNRVINNVLEKEGKIVTLYFNKEVKDKLLELKKYREENDINDNGYVFIAKHDNNYESVSATTLGDWAKRIGILINVPTLHPHDFRHSEATILRNRGMKLEDISTLLNHAGVDVTRQYYIKENIKKISENKDKFEL